MIIDRRTILSRIALLPIAGTFIAGRATAAGPTPFTEIGPFYPVVRPAEQDMDLTLIGNGPRAAGEVIEVVGRILDPAGRPIPGARMEMWQANAAGRYAHAGDPGPRPLDPNFQGYGTLTAGADGAYRITSVLPGAYPIPGGVTRPPHLHFDVTGRNERLITQMIFPGNPLNDTDLVLANVDRKPLTCRDMGKAGNGAHRFEWDIVLSNG
jgi:protocatechuate 3,4-dioxygenase beta subunit